MGDENTKEIIASLARQFYGLGWFPGSGGSLTIRESPDRIFIAPSGVQKERIKAEDIFILDRNAEVIERPPLKRNLRPSQCTPLFMVAYNGNKKYISNLLTQIPSPQRTMDHIYIPTCEMWWESYKTCQLFGANPIARSPPFKSKS